MGHENNRFPLTSYPGVEPLMGRMAAFLVDYPTCNNLTEVIERERRLREMFDDAGLVLPPDFIDDTYMQITDQVELLIEQYKTGLTELGGPEVHDEEGR